MAIVRSDQIAAPPRSHFNLLRASGSRAFGHRTTRDHMTRAAGAFVCVLLVALIVAATAQAGAYSVLTCSDNASGVNHSWDPWNRDNGHVETGGGCPNA